MTTYSVSEAKDNLSKLIEDAIAGDHVSITRHGKPTVRLVAEVGVGSFLSDRKRAVPEEALAELEAIRAKFSKGKTFNWIDEVRKTRDE